MRLTAQGPSGDGHLWTRHVGTCPRLLHRELGLLLHHQLGLGEASDRTYAYSERASNGILKGLASITGDLARVG